MSTDPNDCPAAHSMDTTWFAVDADGNIGVFDSGEAGGVPEGVAVSMSPGGREIDTFALDVLRLTRSWTRSATPPGLLEPADVVAKQRVVVWIDRARAVETTYREHAGVGPFERSVDDLWVLNEAAPRLVATRTALTAEDLACLVEDRTVVGVIEERDFHDWLLEGDTGVYAWSNEDYEAAGAYVRRDEPSEPIRLDELPTPLAQAIASTRLRVSFGDVEAIQLTDHFAPSAIATWTAGATLVAPTEAEKKAQEDDFQRLRVQARERGDRMMRGMVYALVAIVVLAFLGIWLGR